MRVSRWSNTPTSNARSAARTSPCSNAGSTSIPRSPGSGITCRCRCIEPAASAEARLVECVGQTGGHAAFWQAVEWVYANTRGDGQGLPEGLRYPDLTPDAQQCLNSERPDAVIRAQAAEAAQQHIAATPTLRLQDRQSGKTLLLRGPVDGDALLSAIDLLAAGGVAAPSTKEMPAEPIGDMPR
jgi:hypothetical protein